MNKGFSALIDDIAQLPPNWHGAGSVNPKVLRGIAQHAEQIGPVNHSVETGCGRTTLLFSHLSNSHLVFAQDLGRSISQTKDSPLLKAENVIFVEGPTQVTLPNYNFTQKFQIALLDGPHGYPFPDLEYYYFYPLIATGGLLLVDDIQIPSIGRMFEIIKADQMFDLLEIIGNMAILKRSEAPLVDPLSDSWWLQGYNRGHWDEINGLGVKSSLLSWLAGMAPKRVKMMIPASLKKMAYRM